VYPIIEAQDEGWTNPKILGCFGLAALLSTLFVRWELHVKEPMLNLSFFRNPRFSVASGAIGLAFFALFGSIFALTQWMQDAHGYSALQAGAAMVPLAFGLVLGAVSSIKLVRRFGTTRIVMAGLLGLGINLALSLTWASDMAYLPLGGWFFAVALNMGWIMGPATESVMGAVPEDKSGVASAMNDVTRQVGGSLGTAVIGSLISSLYASRVDSSVTSLPASAQTAAEDSIGKANAVAEKLPADQAAHLTHAAAGAFTDAMAIGFTVAGVVAVAAAIVVKLWLPAKHIEQTVAAAEELPDDERLAA
jgi:MFS transporter, DHA2 family, multidrug resistance protein